MAIALITAGTVGENALGSTTLTCPYPTGMSSSSMMVLFVSTASGAGTAATNPAGWTQVARFGSTGSTTSPTLLMSIKQATGSESGNLSVTTTSSTSIGQIIAFSGVDLTTPQDVAATTVDSTTIANTTPLPTLTTSRTGVALVYGAGFNGTTATSTPPTSPSTFTETGDKTGGGARSGAMGYLIWSGSGATGTVSVNWSTTARSVGGLVALRPATATANTGQFFAMF